jgi:hypothetical protein
MSFFACGIASNPLTYYSVRELIFSLSSMMHGKGVNGKNKIGNY